jgi:two-component system, NtrC family, sensor kinase
LLPERYEDSEFRETFFTLIGGEVQRIDSIVNRLLNFARPPEAAMVPASLHAVLEDSLRLMEEQARKQGLRVTRQFAATQDRIRGDTELLRQAFVNFLLNAIQATGRGGEISVVTATVPRDRRYAMGASVRPGAQGVRVVIKDTGAGIREEDLPHIFDPFFTTKPEGTGLGLAVSHGILQEHGAYVDVESKVGVGTTFYLVFPVLTDDREGPT